MNFFFVVCLLPLAAAAGKLQFSDKPVQQVLKKWLTPKNLDSATDLIQELRGKAKTLEELKKRERANVMLYGENLIKQLTTQARAIEDLKKQERSKVLLYGEDLIKQLTMQSGNARVVGGIEAEENAHPWQVSLRHCFWDGLFCNPHFCGGVLINTEWVLTAAHCLDGQRVSTLTVRLGVHNLGIISSDEQNIYASQFILHESYNGSTNGYPYDIGLIRLSSPAILNYKVQIISMADGSKTYDGQKCTITGWGNIEGGGPSPDILQKADMTVITNEYCATLWSGHGLILDSHICVHEQEKSACHGDSGGPLTCEQELVGVTSWGNANCHPDSHPSVYTRVSKYKTWVKNTIASHSATYMNRH